MENSTLEDLAKFPSEDPNPVMRIAQDGTLLYANSSSKPLLNQWGSVPGELLPGEWKQRIAQACESETSQEIEIRLGEETFALLLTPVAGTEYINLYGVNITARKQAEEQIFTSRRMLAEAEQIAHMGSFEWNIPANTLTWSDGLYRIYGLQAQEFGATFEAFLNQVHPDDRERVKRTVEEAYSDAKPFSMEERIVRPDGTVRVLLSRAEIIKGEKGELTRIVGICQDITDQKRAEAALKYRSDFENLITEISTYFINLSPKAIDGGINDALEKIGEFVGADRSYVFLLHDEGTKGSSTHEWCAEGISSGMEKLQELPAEMFPWFMGFLYHGEAVHIPSTADLPPEARAERGILESQQTRSLICVPMVSRGSLIGFLGVDSVRKARSWSEDVIRLLKIAGEIFANALQHKWDREALQRACRGPLQKRPGGAGSKPASDSVVISSGSSHFNPL